MTKDMPRYAAVPAAIDLPAMDHEIIALWEANGTFGATLEHPGGAATGADAPRWNFYEGPPTANGTPGTHHIEARVFKDVFPRYRTMQGFRVDRKAGWDCHGLAVELAVEGELGIDSKSDIEEYGIKAFNERCRESVGRHVGQFAELTRRMGYWVNMDDAYWTLNPEYIDSEWWALKRIFKDGLLVEDFRVTPYCPHDQTALSDHEVAQGYEDVTDPTVYVRLPLTSGRDGADLGPWQGASLLIWTTTPWTLISNTAVAVHPDVTYVLASNGDGEKLVVAQALMAQVLGESWQAQATISGREMERWAYQRPYAFVEFGQPANYVVLGDFVTTEDGTGLVHEAPAFGAIDMACCRAYGLPIVNPVRPDGTFDDVLPLVGGLFFKRADEKIIDDLKTRGLLFALEMHEHSYPFCWRCHSPLMYYAVPSWYIRTTERAPQLLASNESTNWYPDTIKWGRYGDWLRNNIDWALSRTRFWGTPLPIWRNDADPSHIVCIGSRAELAKLSGDPAVATMDPHRPFVDDVVFTLPGEAGVYRRVPEVIDAWFDSGSMPFAQWGYPWVPGSKEKFEQHFPADFICEATDQTRGWFYTLMAVSTLVFGENSYRNVVCLGHILAEDGRKMSKHLGNILLPIPLLEKHGADAVRWFMACAGSPWAARRVGDGTIQEVVRKVLLTYWNTVAFHALYARANDWTPARASGCASGCASGDERAKGDSPFWHSASVSGDSVIGDERAKRDSPQWHGPAVADRHVLDRWLVSRTNRLVADVTGYLDDFDTQHVGSALAAFIDDLSNWYVRRSRRRFWAGDPGALWTLHETLEILTRLMAPLTPFVTERVWQDLFVATDADAPASVHLASWPKCDDALIDGNLEASMDLTRRLVELGRAARAEAKMKTRQPLARVLISAASDVRLTDELRAEITSELNVGEVATFASAGDVVDYSAKANFRALGKRFGGQTQQVASAVAAADAALLARSMATGGCVVLDVSGIGEVSLGPDEVIVSERPREGWSVLQDGGETVALDLALTPELVQAGLARDVIRLVQDARKASGFDVSDRIALVWASNGNQAGEATAEAIRARKDEIAEEVLATAMAEGPVESDNKFEDEALGVVFAVAIV